jgi:hypothetical protein
MQASVLARVIWSPIAVHLHDETVVVQPPIFIAILLPIWPLRKVISQVLGFIVCESIEAPTGHFYVCENGPRLRLGHRSDRLMNLQEVESIIRLNMQACSLQYQLMHTPLPRFCNTEASTWARGAVDSPYHFRNHAKERWNFTAAASRCITLGPCAGHVTGKGRHERRAGIMIDHSQNGGLHVA